MKLKYLIHKSIKGGSAGNPKPGSVSDAQQQFDIGHH